MTAISRRYPNTRLLNMALLFACLIAAPVFVFIMFGKWAESPMRQVVAFTALVGMSILAFIKNKHEILALAIVFLSQFMVSLMSFELDKPVIQTIILLDVLLVILLVYFIEVREKLTLRHLVGWVFLALIVWQLAITPLSAHIDRSISFSITQAKFFVLYLIISNLSFSEKFYRRLPWAICGILLIQTTIELAQLKFGYLGLVVIGEGDPTKSYLNYFQGTLRAAGTLGATNGLGGYMAAALVFLTPFLLSRPSITRYAIFGYGLLGLIIPLSRAGWLSFLVGSAIVMFQMLRSKLISPIKVAALGVLTIIMLSGVAYLKWDIIMQRFTDKNSMASAEGRAGQFPYAIAMGAKNPIFGLGPGITYFYGTWTDDAAKYIRHSEQAKEVRFNEMVHNSFLQYLLEDGWPGAIIFASLNLAALANALRKVNPRQPQQTLRMGAAAAAFTCLLHTQFGPEVNNQQLLTLFAFALAISCNKYLLGYQNKHREAYSYHAPGYRSIS